VHLCGDGRQGTGARQAGSVPSARPSQVCCAPNGTPLLLDGARAQAALKGAEDADDADAAARAEKEVEVEMDEFTKVCGSVPACAEGELQRDRTRGLCGCPVPG